jgi:hypothetical protein
VGVYTYVCMYVYMYVGMFSVDCVSKECDTEKKNLNLAAAKKCYLSVITPMNRQFLLLFFFSCRVGIESICER